MLQLSYQKYDWEKLHKLLHLPRVNLPEKRYEICRSEYEIFNMLKDSTDLLKKNMFDCYLNRPDKNLKKMYYAEFSASTVWLVRQKMKMIFSLEFWTSWLTK